MIVVGTAAAQPENVVSVPNAIFHLMRRADIRPPAKAGDLLNPGYVSEKLAASDLTVGEKLQAKIGLQQAGLLVGGRAVDQR